MSQVLLLDSNIWSHLILGTDPKRASVQAGLRKLLERHPGAARATSRLCIAECLVAARRLSDADDRQRAEAAFMAEFTRAELMVVEVSAEVLDLAATMRSERLRAASAAQPTATYASADGGRLRLPDAIVAASCIVAFQPHAILVTENDRDFRFADVHGAQTVGGLIVERVA